MQLFLDKRHDLHRLKCLLEKGHILHQIKLVVIVKKNVSIIVRVDVLIYHVEIAVIHKTIYVKIGIQGVGSINNPF